VIFIIFTHYKEEKEKKERKRKKAKGKSNLDKKTNELNNDKNMSLENKKILKRKNRN